MQELSSVSVKTVLVVAVLLVAGVVFYVGVSRNTRSVEAADSGRCSLKPETGPCRGLFPKFYYDSSSKSCKSFTYGGCDGNDNRFDTDKECMAACGGQ
ncbi:trypsin inhibitor-like isoform X2 [Oculina patagonica]